ncbi:hypothetical protein [Agromyces seonyuensis]|uniref:Uncharacterized protein n=1 Tax=Agromyces seonyuensis TaxID=2662446 RepID=A0A6I4P5L8_9MICO|nr:hypothetical protein [Agromyces seonyuensis]MWB98744.1 hypothetical protein [Agromyces seonyuensis]
MISDDAALSFRTAAKGVPTRLEALARNTGEWRVECGARADVAAQNDRGSGRAEARPEPSSSRAYGHTVTMPHQTLKTQGWVEWVNGVVPTTTTIHQQFDCHAVFGYAIWEAGLWWDFETARGSIPNWFTDPQKCNWA